MTEQDWLSSADPAAMLAFLNRHPRQPAGVAARNASARQLRLFACACLDLCTCTEGERLDWTAQQWIEIVAHPHPGADRCSVTPAAQAALLRDIFGNPFRPVRLPETWMGPEEALPLTHSEYTDRDCRRRGWLACPWLTPLVLSLAQAAYEERLKVECGRCEGGRDQSRYLVVEPDGHGHGHPRAYHRCPDCHGTGTRLTAHLDPGTLGTLSDALEEAGCTEQALLMHLRGWEVCLECRSTGKEHFIADGVKHERWRVPLGVPCTPCGGKGWVPLCGPHVRGCWALDTILGKD